MSDAIKYLVVSTTANEEDVEHSVDEYGDGSWTWEEESWGPVSLEVVGAFDTYVEAQRKADSEVFYAMVSVYPNKVEA